MMPIQTRPLSHRQEHDDKYAEPPHRVLPQQEPVQEGVLLSSNSERSKLPSSDGSVLGIDGGQASGGSGGTRGGLHSFLQRQGSTAFWGADLPYSRYFTRCQEGHFRALLFVPRRAPVDLFETNKKPIGWSHRRPKIRDQKLSSGLLLMFMATHLLQFTSQFLSNIACSL